MKPLHLMMTLTAFGLIVVPAQSQVKKSTVDGIRNFAQ